MKNVLVPTDFSKNAWKALEYSIHLFEKDVCTFYLLNAFQTEYFTTTSLMVPEPGEPAYDLAHEQSKEGLEKLLDSLSLMNENPNHHFKIISMYNSVTEAIKWAIEKYNINLVVMGTKGSGDPENRIFGSNTVHVSDHCNTCPLLIVPENALFVPDIQKEVVFATNFRYKCSQAGVNYVSEIANRFSATIRVLYVQEHDQMDEQQETNRDYLQELFRNISHSFHTLTNISVTKGIITFIESRGSQLLILNREKPGFFKKIFSRSVLHQITKKPRVPILVLPETRYLPRLF
ncbi:universal stress protein [Salegentibacter sp. F14]